MGSVFGKESVEEPPHDTLLSRSDVTTPYELRKYGQRFAATITYKNTGDKSENSPFGALAKYIGVFGTPQNEGDTSIAMTAPVVMENSNKPTQIAMTAPVVMEDHKDDGSDSDKKMMFMLPVEYDSMDKIPKPTNQAVHIEEIPSQTGVVHVYNGKWGEKRNKELAKDLAQQLIQDGVPDLTEEYVLANYQFWGYNPPFTLPYFRRNEIWVQLESAQVDYLEKTFKPEVNATGKPAMKGRNRFTIGALGLVLGCCALNLLWKKANGSQYRRISA
ncbi:hypothetical protein ACHAWT_001574 [Skeletonema menzelii]|eukprot:scaffold27857_cov154-Skeletonema_menzelii.AAC.4